MKVKTCWMPLVPAIMTGNGRCHAAAERFRLAPMTEARDRGDHAVSGAASAAIGPASVASAEKLNRAAKNSSQNNVPRLSAPAWVKK